MAQEQRYKRYVSVIVDTTEDGVVTPLAVEWADGRTFQVEGVIGPPQRRHSIRAGGTGICYTIRVLGQVTRLWYEGPRWFVEAKPGPSGGPP